MKHGSMSYKTHLKCTNTLIWKLELKIRLTLPNKFELVSFDEWTAGDAHYVSIFATFPSDLTNVYNNIILCFSHFEEENSKSANSHLELTEYQLNLYDRSL